MAVCFESLMLEGKPSPQSEVQSALEQIFVKDLGVLNCIHLSLYEDESPRSRWWETSPRHDAATVMLHCKDGISPVRSSAWFPPDVTLGIQAKKFDFGFIRP